jgi:hypothetical protein
MSTDRIHTRTSGVPAIDSPIGTLAHDPATKKLYIKSTTGTGIGAWGPGIGAESTVQLINDEAFSITVGQGVVIAGTGTNRVEVATEADSKRLIAIAMETVTAGSSGSFTTLLGTIVTIQLVTGLTLTEGDLAVINTGGNFTNVATTTTGEFVKGGVLLTDVSAYIGGTPANSFADGVFVSDRPSENA